MRAVRFPWDARSTGIWRPPAQLRTLRHDGVGLAFAVGAKAAKPEAQVICLHGDGSFGQNAMEVDTAVRHKPPLLCVISLNGGWIADPEGNKPGRYLGYTRYEKDGRGTRLLCRICRRTRGHPPGLAARVEEGRGGYGPLCQRQDRLSPGRGNRRTIPASHQISVWVSSNNRTRH